MNEFIFQGSFRVYPLPGDPNAPVPPRHLDNLPPSTPEECIVRVYIVKAMDLQPNDPSGLVCHFHRIYFTDYLVRSGFWESGISSIISKILCPIS